MTESKSQTSSQKPVRAGFMARFRNRSNLSLRAQILFALIALTLIIFVAVGFVLWRTLSEDRLPYFTEVHLKKNLEIEARLRVFLRKREGTVLRGIDNSGATYESMFLPRWPVSDEVFVGSADQEMIIGRHDDETLWTRPFGDLSSFWKVEDGFAYLITTGGINLGSSRPDRMSAKTGMKRKEIDDFFRSGIAAGARILKDPAEGDRVVAHREVAGSNVVLFTETPLSELQSEQWEGFKPIALGLSGAALLMLMVGIYLVNAASRPLSHIVSEIQTPHVINRNISKSSDFSDEFQSLFELIHMIKLRIAGILAYQREEHIIRSLCNDFMRKAAQAKTQEELLQEYISVIVRYPRAQIRNASLDVYFYQHKNTETSDAALLRFALSDNGRRTNSSAGYWVKASDVSEGGFSDESVRPAALESNGNELRIPLRVSKIRLGFAVFSFENIASVINSDRRWLSLLSGILSEAIWQQNPDA